MESSWFPTECGSSSDRLVIPKGVWFCFVYDSTVGQGSGLHVFEVPHLFPIPQLHLVLFGFRLCYLFAKQMNNGSLLQIKETIVSFLKWFPYLPFNHLFPGFAETLFCLFYQRFEGFRETAHYLWKPSIAKISTSAGMACATWYPSFPTFLNVFLWDSLSSRRGIACSTFK